MEANIKTKLIDMVYHAIKFDKLLDDKQVAESSPTFLSICRDELEKLNSTVDTDSFLYDLGMVIRRCCFYNSFEAESVNQGLLDYGIAEPLFIKKCNFELESRTKYINRLIDGQKYLLSPEESLSFTAEINLDLEAYTTTVDNKLKYLNTLLEDTVLEIKEQDKSSEKHYGYSLKSFYTGEDFNGTKDDLNMYFYNATSNNHTSNEFSELYHNLRTYIDKRKKVKVIRNLILEYQNVGKPNISTTQNFIEDIEKITESYKVFNKLLFEEMRFDDYLNCFDLNSSSLKHPVFIQGKQADFVYFLSQIPKIRINDKIAEQHFGIKYYKQQISKMPNRMPVFVNQIRAILKIS